MLYLIYKKDTVTTKKGRNELYVHEQEIKLNIQVP